MEHLRMALWTGQLYGTPPDDLFSLYVGSLK